MNYPNFSVLMSVYIKEDPEFFSQSILSILRQTILPGEIIIVKDGPLTDELEAVINKYCDDSIFKIVELKENVGLGKALNIGLLECENELVARMDTDDICVKNRFELQLTEFMKNSNLSIVGGQIEEFIDTPTNRVGKRRVPLEDAEIKERLKRRNPFNHVTVMFKKKEVLNAGNYQEMSFVEDYYLWCRMYLNNNEFLNLSETLTYVRVGKDMYRRRGGYNYFKSWNELEKFKHDNCITTKTTKIRTLSERFIIQVLMPNSIRGWIFRNYSREKIKM